MPSDWIKFCKDYSDKHNIKYSEALKKCSALYNKKGKTTEDKEIEELEPQPEKPRRRRRKKQDLIEPI